MAIVQISRITNRKGLAVDLPDPLAGAELGWVIDERRLFIGNGELADGAPAVGNTEILTEYSDILAIATAYTYQGLAGGYVVQTGPTPGDPVTQSLQSRLDSYAIVTDFGAVGDGTTDNTAAINRALYQLYCVDTNPAVRRSLFFPAGEYLVTGTVLVPAFATLYGEGNNASIIKFEILPWTDAAPWQAGTLVYYQGDYYRSNIAVPPGTSIENTIYWTQETEPEYALRTADSLQQTGVNITTNGAVRPQSIELVNLKITTNIVQDAVLIEDAEKITFRNVAINGPFTTNDITEFATNTVKNADELVPGYQYIIDSVGTTDFTLVGAASNTVGVLFTATDPTTGTGTAALQNPNTSAVAWASTVSLVTNNVLLDNCEFAGFSRAMYPDQQIESVVISNSDFDTLYQGAYLGGASPVNGGPSGVRFVQNSFDNIYGEGLIFENVELNSSGYNIFYDVGNEFAGVAYPFAPIIDIRTSNNVSIGDMFERTLQQAEDSGNPRVLLNNTVSIATDGADAIQLGTYTRKSGIQTTLPNNTGSATTLFSFDAIANRAITVNTTITRGQYTQTGVITIVSGRDASGTGLLIDSSMFDNNGGGGIGVTFTATETASVVSLKYTTTNTGTDAIISYSVTRLA